VSTPSTGSAASSAAAPASSAGSPSVAASSAGTQAAGPSTAASQSATSTFLAEGQDINGAAVYEPACDSGCPLSGDGTAILFTMKWTTWSATEAVGTGTYKLDVCNPNCAAGTVYPVATVVTLSQPVKVCSRSGTHWVWSHASFTFPRGLPKALQGQDAPENPWPFSTVVAAAQQTCS
jgi:hypothetical protein